MRIATTDDMWQSENHRNGYEACIKHDGPNTGLLGVLSLACYSLFIVLGLLVWHGVGELPPWVLALPLAAIVVLHKLVRNVRASADRKRFHYHGKPDVSSWFVDGKLRTYPPGSVVTRQDENGILKTYFANGEVNEAT